MTTLTIDAEFQGKIPPLGEAEFQQLKENILEAGEVYEPIVVWNGVIVDGHNRWKIVQEHPEITYKVREMNFADKWAAFDWMYKNQLGRRNLTDAQRTYLLGKLYEARKHSHGAEPGGRGNQYTEVVRAQSGHIPTRVSEQIAHEQGVSHNQVKRAEHFAQGVDTVRTVSPETADNILNGKIKVIKHDVAEIAQAAKVTPEIVPSMVEQIKAGQRVTKVDTPVHTVNKPSGKYNGGGTKEYREQMNRIAETASRLYNTEEKTEYKLGNLADEIRWNTDNYLRLLKNLLADHSELVNANKEAVKAMLDDQIIEKIKLIKEEIDK